MTDAVHDEKAKNDSKGFLTPGNVFLLSAILTAAVIVGIALSQQLKTQPTDGPAPDFAFETFDGQAMSLSDLQGNIVVLNFWASWCGPCRQEAPDLQAVYEDYQDENVIFLGIAWVDNGPASRGFLEEFGITYLNAPDI
ncbi:MAG: TlpA family protein disulfide reductase, partial [Aggregatilineales bacterium]